MKTLKLTLKILIKKAVVGVAVLSACLIIPLAISTTVAAQCGPQNAGLPGCQSGGPNVNGQSNPTPTNACNNTTNSTGNVSSAAVQKCLDQSPIVHDLQIIVNFLSAAVGIVVIAVIILGGIQYSLAGDNAQATTAAKQRITNGLIALMAFIFTFAFLQWLIPGGIFK